MPGGLRATPVSGQAEDTLSPKVTVAQRSTEGLLLIKFDPKN